VAEHLRAGVWVRIDGAQESRGKRAVVHGAEGYFTLPNLAKQCADAYNVKAGAKFPHSKHAKRAPPGPNNVALVSPPPSPCFSQVLILKGVKVLCFDTLLQVLILKGFRG